MKYLAMFMLHWLQFDLARALNAPVRNAGNIEWINARIEEWQLVLIRKEIQG